MLDVRAHVRQTFTSEPQLLSAALDKLEREPADRTAGAINASMVERAISRISVPSQFPTRAQAAGVAESRAATSGTRGALPPADDPLRCGGGPRENPRHARLDDRFHRLVGGPARPQGRVLRGQRTLAQPRRVPVHEVGEPVRSGGPGAGVLAPLEARGLSLSSDFRNLVARANAGRVTFYAIDASGGVAPSAPSAEQAVLNPEPGINTSETMGKQHSMQHLAFATGGEAIAATPDPSAMFTRLLRDFDTYYSVAYPAPRIGDGKDHSITVKVRRDGAVVRYRRHYLDKTADDRVVERNLSALLHDSGSNSLEMSRRRWAHRCREAAGRSPCLSSSRCRWASWSCSRRARTTPWFDLDLPRGQGPRRPNHAAGQAPFLAQHPEQQPRGCAGTDRQLHLRVGDGRGPTDGGGERPGRSGPDGVHRHGPLLGGRADRPTQDDPGSPHVAAQRADRPVAAAFPTIARGGVPGKRRGRCVPGFCPSGRRASGTTPGQGHGEPPPVGVRAALGPAALLVLWRTSGAPRRKRELAKSKTHGPVRYDFSLLTDDDLYLFNEGTHYRALREARLAPGTRDGEDGTVLRGLGAGRGAGLGRSATSTAGTRAATPCGSRGQSGIWEGFVPGVGPGARCTSTTWHSRIRRLPGRTRPTPSPSATRPRRAPPPSSGTSTTPGATRTGWRAGRAPTRSTPRCSIYEVHLGSWRRVPEEGDRFLTYRELAPALADYVERDGLHPRRVHAGHGAPLLRLLGLPDHRLLRPHQPLRHAPGPHVPRRHPAPARHRRHPGLGALALPADEHGLAYFDGTHLYEHADPPPGLPPRLGQLHLQLRPQRGPQLPAVERDVLARRTTTPTACGWTRWPRCCTWTTRARQGEWIPNALRRPREPRGHRFPAPAQRGRLPAAPRRADRWPRSRPPGRWSRARPTWAASASASSGTWGGCTTPSTTSRRDPVHRKFHHNELTFRSSTPSPRTSCCPSPTTRSCTARGRCSARCRGTTGRSSPTCGCSSPTCGRSPARSCSSWAARSASGASGTTTASLDWHLLEHAPHRGLRELGRGPEPPLPERAGAARAGLRARRLRVGGLQRLGGERPHLPAPGRTRRRRGAGGAATSPRVPRPDYRVGVPAAALAGAAQQRRPAYGGSGLGNMGGLDAEPVPHHGRPLSLQLTLPPLGAVFLKREAPQA